MLTLKTGTFSFQKMTAALNRDNCTKQTIYLVRYSTSYAQRITSLCHFLALKCKPLNGRAQPSHCGPNIVVAGGVAGPESVLLRLHPGGGQLGGRAISHHGDGSSPGARRESSDAKQQNKQSR